MFLIDVRYTNYVRLNGFLQTDQNNAGNEENIAAKLSTKSTEPLHPSNDPEHEGEIRYCRRRPVRQGSQPKAMTTQNQHGSQPKAMTIPNQQGSQPKAMTNQNQNGQTYERIKKNKKGRVVKIIPMDDSRVIPYNPYLLLKFGCHINIEYVFGQKACKYIFKYLLKGILF